MVTYSEKVKNLAAMYLTFGIKSKFSQYFESINNVSKNEKHKAEMLFIKQLQDFVL
jgi:hypothetical protein